MPFPPHSLALFSATKMLSRHSFFGALDIKLTKDGENVNKKRYLSYLFAIFTTKDVQSLKSIRCPHPTRALASGNKGSYRREDRITFANARSKQRAHDRSRTASGGAEAGKSRRSSCVDIGRIRDHFCAAGATGRRATINETKGGRDSGRHSICNHAIAALTAGRSRGRKQGPQRRSAS